MAVSKKGDKVALSDPNVFRKKILAWYDKHQRILPWRVGKGETPNPYYVWLSEIMLQQTTVVTVGPYFQKFIEKWPTVHDLASAERDEVMHEWAGLGYYARARNLHKCAAIVSTELDGQFPSTQKELEKLPGIGGYTSAAIRAIAFNKPANVVDGNIERVMSRVFAVTEPLPASKPYLKELAGQLSEDFTNRPGDYAQALMDLGATICTPTSPKCSLCPVRPLCHASQQGIAEELPRKMRKKAKPQKYGHVYWITKNEDEILFVRRAETEMLGGMLGLPTSEWVESHQNFKSIKGTKANNLSIKHSFTHFDLILDVYVGDYDKIQASGMIPPSNHHFWMSFSELDNIGLPTVFKKVVKLMK